MKTINQIAQEYGVHPIQVGQWKREIQAQAKSLFEGKRGPQPVSAESAPERLYGEIGRLKMELDWLKKKVRDQPAMIRHAWIGAHANVTQKRQCVLAGVSRTTFYVKRKPVVFVESDEVLKRLIDEEYTRHPFYGSRKMVVYLGRCGHLVNRKRVQRLMRCMSLAGMAPGPGTSQRHPQHKVYPYLLHKAAIGQANQVWALDTAYIPMARGFVYLTAVVDVASRKVLAHKVAITPQACHAREILEQAFARYGVPEIVNTDQGSQFTAEEFTHASTSGYTCAPMTASLPPRRILRNSSTGTTPSGRTAAWTIKRRTRPTGRCCQRCRRWPIMKIPGAPRVAHRVGRFVASAARRRGQLCTCSTRPLSLYLLG